MDYISLITAILKIIGSITGFLHDKKLIDAGAAQATGAALAAANAELDKAGQVAREADQIHKDKPGEDGYDKDFEDK